MKISVIVPTCYRPDMFRAMLESLYSTTQGYEIETIVLIDEDVETVGVLNSFPDEDITVNFRPTMRGAITCWNLGLSLSSGDIIVPAGDDQKFYPKWLEYALESHEKKVDGYGVIGMNDLAYDGNAQLATIVMFDRKFCKDVLGGVIAPPVYNYYCVDSEINAKSKAMGKFYWDDRSIVEHLHSAHGKRPLDMHDISRGDLMGKDNLIFEDRKLRGFPIEWESLI